MVVNNWLGFAEKVQLRVILCMLALEQPGLRGDALLIKAVQPDNVHQDPTWGALIRAVDLSGVFHANDVDSSSFYLHAEQIST